MSGPEKCAGCDSTPAAECCYPGGYPELPIADVPDETGRRLAAHVAQARALGEARARIATLEREVERLRARPHIEEVVRALITECDDYRLADRIEARLRRALDAHPTQTEDET